MPPGLFPGTGHKTFHNADCLFDSHNSYMYIDICGNRCSERILSTSDSYGTYTVEVQSSPTRFYTNKCCTDVHITCCGMVTVGPIASIGEMCKCCGAVILYMLPDFMLLSAFACRTQT